MEKVFLISFLSSLIISLSADVSKNTIYVFPNTFSFGAATAAFQIEGAWNQEGKGESIWDNYIHSNESRVLDGSNADVSCDSYHKYKEDIKLAADMGLTHYRFSISWTRILPNGDNNEKSFNGILYYQNVIKEIEKYNMTPMVTIYHWDLPETLQNIGGWTNPKIVDYFLDYAEIVFESLPTVKFWVTINEPKQVCQGGYGKGSLAPGYTESGIGDYLCSYNIIKAHASVYKLYQNKFKNLGGKITMALDGTWSIPYSDEEEDKKAAERRLAFEFGLYAHPIFFGDWPDVVKERVNNRSTNENFTTSRLPAFTEDDITLINGTADYVAFNFYDTKLIQNAEEADYSLVSYENDLRIINSVDPAWTITIDGDTTIYPQGLREYLNWININYNKPEIYITENGIADDGSSLEDYDRIYYLADHLYAVLESIFDDNVNVKAYTMWSLLDNFEWRKGYSLHMGFYSVDFNEPDRTRSPKKSVSYFKQLIKDRNIPDLPVTTPRPSTITTDAVTTPSPSTITTDAVTTPKPSTITTDAVTTPSPTITTDATTHHHNSGRKYVIDVLVIAVSVIIYTFI